MAKTTENRYKRKFTFTALAVSSVNGGTIPVEMMANERPNSRQVEMKIDLFAPRQIVYINSVRTNNSQGQQSLICND